jgi:uncharacterized membrane protein YbhN (UPF0104 family)
MPKRLKSLAGITVLTACFFFLGRSLLTNWRGTDIAGLDLDWVLLVVSWLLLAVPVLFSALLWKITLSYLGECIDFVTSVRIICLSMLPKYVPGKVWGMMGQVWLTKKEAGIPGEKGGVAVVLSTAMAILSGTLLGVVILPTALGDSVSPKLYFVFLIVPILLVALHPAVFIKTLNFALRKANRDIVQFVPRYTQLLKLLLMYIVFWLLQCLVVYLMIRSFYYVDLRFLLCLCGIFPLAWVVGFVSLITPGGLGVREGALAYLLGFYMPISMAIMASILIRIWATVAEVALFAIFARNLKKYL